MDYVLKQYGDMKEVIQNPKSLTQTINIDDVVKNNLFQRNSLPALITKSLKDIGLYRI